MKIARRLAIKLPLLSAPLFLPSAVAPQKRIPNKPYLVYVGTYTNKNDSQGIYAYLFDPGIGKLSRLGVAAESEDPSFLAVHPGGKFLYAQNVTDHFS